MKSTVYGRGTADSPFYELEKVGLFRRKKRYLNGEATEYVLKIKKLYQKSKNGAEK